MFGKIKNFIFKIIYIFVIIYLLIFVPTIWGEKPLVVISGSMEPTLNVGGILYYHDKEYSNFEKGDIIVFQLNDHIVSHRVFDITENGIISKGDANDTYDSILVKEKQVLGIGTNWYIPLIGYYADFIYNHKYLLFVVLIIILLDFISVKKKEDKENEKKD